MVTYYDMVILYYVCFVYCIIVANLSDNNDINRNVQCLYAMGKLLIRNVMHCSEDYEIKLSKSDCINVYGCMLWT